MTKNHVLVLTIDQPERVTVRPGSKHILAVGPPISIFAAGAALVAVQPPPAVLQAVRRQTGRPDGGPTRAQ